MRLERERGAGTGSPPFLTVVTRCYKRPTYLEKNVASLAGQSDPDYEQVFIIDDVGKGLHAANKALAMAAFPDGEYVLILDDDDMLSDPGAIAALKLAVESYGQPELLFFKADHADHGILPSPVAWNRMPVHGHIGSCDFISRRDVWQKHIRAFGAPQSGDYQYLMAVWADRPHTAWLDRELAAVQNKVRARSWGRPEAELI